MGAYHIIGGNTLRGSVKSGGAKNAALPILAASVMGNGVSVIKNCPDIADVNITADILRSLGCGVTFDATRDGNVMTADAGVIGEYRVSGTHAKQMRSSIIFMGALLARVGKAALCMPGGCHLGDRKIDFHVNAFRAMGVDVEVDETDGCIDCSVDDLVGADIDLPFPSVGATENIMLLATAARGVTTITNAAKEPEIVDLQNYLNAMGAKVSGAGTRIVAIEGGRELFGAEYAVMPDRIAAGTFMCAAAVTGGEIEVTGADAAELIPLTEVLSAAGCEIRKTGAGVYIKAAKRLRAFGEIATMPHPGFPTDMQPQITVVAALASGESVIRETVFEKRTAHVPELLKMGANIAVMADGRTIKAAGTDKLRGADVSASDLRCGAALIIAGLAAEGATVVRNGGFVERGYERIEAALRGVGGEIELEVDG